MPKKGLKPGDRLGPLHGALPPEKLPYLVELSPGAPHRTHIHPHARAHTLFHTFSDVLAFGFDNRSHHSVFDYFPITVCPPGVFSLHISNYKNCCVEIKVCYKRYSDLLTYLR